MAGSLEGAEAGIEAVMKILNDGPLSHSSYSRELEAAVKARSELWSLNSEPLLAANILRQNSTKLQGPKCMARDGQPLVVRVVIEEETKFCLNPRHPRVQAECRPERVLEWSGYLVTLDANNRDTPAGAPVRTRQPEPVREQLARQSSEELDHEFKSRALKARIQGLIQVRHVIATAKFRSQDAWFDGEVFPLALLELVLDRCEPLREFAYTPLTLARALRDDRVIKPFHPKIEDVWRVTNPGRYKKRHNGDLPEPSAERGELLLGAYCSDLSERTELISGWRSLIAAHLTVPGPVAAVDTRAVALVQLSDDELDQQIERLQRERERRKSVAEHARLNDALVLARQRQDEAQARLRAAQQECEAVASEIATLEQELVRLDLKISS